MLFLVLFLSLCLAKREHCPVLENPEYLTFSKDGAGITGAGFPTCNSTQAATRPRSAKAQLLMCVRFVLLLESCFKESILYDCTVLFYRKVFILEFNYFVPLINTLCRVFFYTSDHALKWNQRLYSKYLILLQDLWQLCFEVLISEGSHGCDER